VNTVWRLLSSLILFFGTNLLDLPFSWRAEAQTAHPHPSDGEKKVEQYLH
jgi:hypothetical protein